jgi:hypothetical protein
METSDTDSSCCLKYLTAGYMVAINTKFSIFHIMVNLENMKVLTENMQVLIELFVTEMKMRTHNINFRTNFK